MKRLPLPTALAWIVIPTLFITGIGNSCFNYYFRLQTKKNSHPEFHIVSIVQTGPQREALKTVYLAELLNLSCDCPQSIFNFDPERARQKLLRSPVIKEAQIKLLKPSSIHIDYTVRKPIAWLGDYDNCAIDEEGYLFPVTPFFSPKKLPEIYLGLAPFEISAGWGRPLQGKSVDLALHILNLLSEPAYRDLFNNQRIDVSKAFAESYGVREIVIQTEDEMVEKDKTVIIPRLLRLSTKNYAQELGNYLKLRKQLLEQERKDLALNPADKTTPKVIDFRIPSLAFIDDSKK